MARSLLHHRHEAGECGVVFASFRGHGSSLRHGKALGLLPYFVAERATAIRVSEVHIP